MLGCQTGWKNLGWLCWLFRHARSSDLHRGGNGNVHLLWPPQWQLIDDEPLDRRRLDEWADLPLEGELFSDILDGRGVKPVETCADLSSECNALAFAGECARDVLYMSAQCAQSCGHCFVMTAEAAPSPAREDVEPLLCRSWAAVGECDRDPWRMFADCPQSCERSRLWQSSAPDHPPEALHASWSESASPERDEDLPTDSPGETTQTDLQSAQCEARVFRMLWKLARTRRTAKKASFSTFSFDAEARAVSYWHTTLVGPVIAGVIATSMFFILSQVVLWKRLFRCAVGAHSIEKQTVWAAPAPVSSKKLKTRRRGITEISGGQPALSAVRLPQCWSLTDSEGDSDASSEGPPTEGGVAHSICVNLADTMDW